MKKFLTAVKPKFKDKLKDVLGLLRKVGFAVQQEPLTLPIYQSSLLVSQVLSP